MAATTASRSARSTGPGVANSASPSATMRLARVIRCSMAASLTRKARAICLTDSPETMRRASAICWVGGQVGVAADEQQAQYVVAVVRGVDAVGDPLLCVVQIGEFLLWRQLGLARALAHAVQRGVAPHHDQPGGGVSRRAVLGPVAEGAQAGVLEGLLRRIQVAEVAQQRPNGLGPRGGNRRVDPGQVVAHAVTTPLATASGEPAL